MKKKKYRAGGLENIELASLTRGEIVEGANFKRAIFSRAQADDQK